MTQNLSPKSPIIAVVIPAYRVRSQILKVVQSLIGKVDLICVVDDACPEKSGEYLANQLSNDSIHIIYNQKNLGVGGSVRRGYRYCLDHGVRIIVKMDGDGQMNPDHIQRLVEPIQLGQADYTKGNRFFSVASMRNMPKIRLLGNIFLSGMSKAASGYWNILDPNNGFTAIDSRAVRALNLQKVSERYFFESDMLFQLNLIRAKVVDVPIMSQYGDEKSNLSILKASIEFPFKHLRNFLQRIAITYFVRDFSFISIQLLGGLIGLCSGMIYGWAKYRVSQSLGIETQPGSLVIFLFLVLSGSQLLISFANFDLHNVPNKSISARLD